MRIAVFGTGGVGGYFGGKLAQAGEEVIFIARGQHLEALRNQGLRVDSIKGDFLVHRLQATDSPAQIGVVDAVLVAVKAWQVPEAARAIAPIVGPETFVVPLQNGVEAPSQLADVLGREHVLGGLARIISFVAGPGHICHVGAEPFVAFGELDNHVSERAQLLRKAFARAGVAAEIPPDTQAALWEKFLLVVSWGGVGAVTRAPIGVVRGLPAARAMLERAMHEILFVAKARDISLAEDSIAKAWAFFGGLPAAGTTSLRRDIAEGRPSELEAWNGAVVRLGQEAGVETSLHAFIYHSLLPLELRARGRLTFSD